MTAHRRPHLRRLLPAAVALALVALALALAVAGIGTARSGAPATASATAPGDRSGAAPAQVVVAATGGAHHVLAVHRLRGDGAHWRLGLTGVLVTAVALAGPGLLGNAPGSSRGPRRRVGGRPASARAPPAPRTA